MYLVINTLILTTPKMTPGMALFTTTKLNNLHNS